MEDLVSNLMAFYGHVEGLDRKTIITEAKGWPGKALEMSKKVYEELDDGDIDIDPFHPGFDQPRSEGKSFREAHLYNKDLSASITKDNRFGWHDLPTFFQSITPLVAYGSYAGSDLLSIEQMAMLTLTHDVIYAANAAQQNYFLKQQLARRGSTGRGGGNTPGPAGVDRMA